MIEKMPPLEKIYEAWSAIASGRVSLEARGESGEARIHSSNGAKTYTVAWNGGVYASNDSATFWQAYPGYPVIAVLMLRGLLPFCEKCASLLKDVDWSGLNAAHRRDYGKALDEVLKTRRIDPETAADLRREALRALDSLERLEITLKRLRKKTGKNV